MHRSENSSNHLEPIMVLNRDFGSFDPNNITCYAAEAKQRNRAYLRNDVRQKLPLSLQLEGQVEMG